METENTQMDLISFAAVTYIMEMQLRRDMLRKGKDMHHITMPMNIRTARSAEGGHSEMYLVSHPRHGCRSTAHTIRLSTIRSDSDVPTVCNVDPDMS